MKSPVFQWFVAVVASLAAHVLLFLVLWIAAEPEPVEPQSVSEARLDMASYEVDRARAKESAAETESADEAAAEGAAVAGASVPVSRAESAPIPASAALKPKETREKSVLAAASAGNLAERPQALTAETDRPQVIDSKAERLLPAVAEPAAAAAVATPSGAIAAQALPDPQTALRAEPALASALTLASVLPTVSNRPQVIETQAEWLAPAAAEPVAAAALAAPSGAIAALALPGPQSALRAEPALASAQDLASVRPAAMLVSAGAARAGKPVPASAPAAVTLASQGPDSPRIEGLQNVGITSASRRPEAEPGAALELNAAPADQRAAAAFASRPEAASPEGERATAALAWSGAGGAPVDPVSMAAIQAFMQPGNLETSQSSAGEVRDGIEGLLASVPCARLQTTFVPETGQLELRGHVPEDGVKAPVLAALQAHVGTAIPVADNLLVLPRPQCGALKDIGAVGLPQSTDQLTNPRVLGADAHARVYDFSEGDRLEFDLVGPDYDAVLYIDYYDADGRVLHLQPNEYLPLEMVAAQAELMIGSDRQGKPSLEITVGPPFGQEIMVAMATSHPLYEGLRPIVEPAEDYLAYMRGQVAEARVRHVGFKGEWVYFFVRTSAR